MLGCEVDGAVARAVQVDLEAGDGAHDAQRRNGRPAVGERIFLVQAGGGADRQSAGELRANGMRGVDRRGDQRCSELARDPARQERIGQRVPASSVRVARSIVFSAARQ
jgi:hypothetical protein